MNAQEKLDFILRAIVTAGGPEQPEGMDDHVYLLAITSWLLRPPAVQYATSANRPEFTRDGTTFVSQELAP